MVSFKIVSMNIRLEAMDAKTGEVLRAANSVKTGQKLRTRLADGEVESTAR